MSKEPKSFSGIALVGAMVFGVAFSAAAYYAFLKPDDPCKGCTVTDPKPGPVRLTAFFDRASIEDIRAATGSWGGRFYLARRDDGSLSVLAGAINAEGQHVPIEDDELYFLLYKSLGAGTTNLTRLTESQAESAVKAASSADKPAWSVDVDNEMLDVLLGVGVANAIGFQERATAYRDWSFDLAPVNITSSGAYLEGEPSDIRMGAYPCPMHCPVEPQTAYLHKR